MKTIILIIGFMLVMFGCRLGYNVKNNSFDVTITPDDIIELYGLITQRRPISNGQIVTLDSGLRVRMVIPQNNPAEVEDPRPVGTWGE